MKVKTLILASLLMVSFNCFATPAKKETLEELFRLTDMSKMLDAVYAQSEAMAKQSTPAVKSTDAHQSVLAKYSEKRAALMREELSWDKLKTPIMDAYAGVYTDSEVRDIIKFYQTPTGKKMLQKMPELTYVTVNVLQKSMKNFLPKLQSLQAEMAAELEKNSPQNAAKDALKQ